MRGLIARFVKWILSDTVKVTLNKDGKVDSVQCRNK